MDTFVSEAVRDRFEILKPVQKRLVVCVGEGLKSTVTAQRLGISTQDMGEMLVEICDVLGITNVDTSKMQRIFAELGKAYAASQAEYGGTINPPIPVFSMPPVVPPILVSPEAISVDQLAEKITCLKEKQKSTISAVVHFGKRGGSHSATSLGISSAGLSIRLKVIYKSLNLSSLGNLKKRELLERGWSRYKAKYSPQVKEPILEPTTPKPTGDLPDTPIDLPKLPVVNGSARHKSVDVTQKIQTAPLPAVSESGSYGTGVVIPLPEDLVDLDVISQEFSNAPPQSLKASIEARKQKGFKPTYVVLSPSTTDPSVTRAQVVFFQYEKKSEN